MGRSRVPCVGVAMLAFAILLTSTPGSAAPRKPTDNKLKFPIDMPLPPKPKAKKPPQPSGGFGVDEAEVRNATPEQAGAVDQIIDVLGLGYNSFKREQQSNCVDGFINGPRPSTFKTSYHLSLIKSSAQLQEEMKADASASADMFGWSAKASAAYSSQHSSDTNTEYLLLKVRSVATPNITLHRPKLVVELKDQSPAALQQFFNDCGDEYVRAVDFGGEFVALWRYKSDKVEDRNAFEAAFSVSGPSVSVDVDYAQKMQSFKSHMSLALDFDNVGGSGAPTDNSVDAIIKYSLEFPRSLNASNIAYVGFETEPYSKLRVRSGDYQAQRQKVDAARDSLVKRRSYLAFLSDVAKQDFQYGVGDVNAPIRAEIGREIRDTESRIAACAKAPWEPNPCNFPPQLLSFRDDKRVMMPLPSTLDPKSTGRAQWRTSGINRHFKVVGRICFSGDRCASRMEYQTMPRHLWK